MAEPQKDLSAATAKEKAMTAIRAGASKVLLVRQTDDKTKWTLTATAAGGGVA